MKKQVRTVLPTKSVQVITLLALCWIIIAYSFWMYMLRDNRTMPIFANIQYKKPSEIDLVNTTILTKNMDVSARTLQIEKETWRTSKTAQQNQQNVKNTCATRAAIANKYCTEVLKIPATKNPVNTNKRSSKFDVVSGSHFPEYPRTNISPLAQSLGGLPVTKWVYYSRVLTKELSVVVEVTVASFYYFIVQVLWVSENVLIKWCPIFKAASSAWMAVFLQLKGALTPLTEKQIHEGKLVFTKLAHDFRLNIPKNTFLSTTRQYSMVVVRHPFERILSAYRDKLERTLGREYFYKNYGLEIVHKFRKSPHPFRHKIRTNINIRENLQNKTNNIFPFSKTGTMYHQEFLTEKERDRINGPVNGTSSGHGGHIPSDLIEAQEHHQRVQLPVPTFEEFIMYLLTVPPIRMNEHWRPMYIDCHPCWNHFDFVLKVETMADDKDVILDLLADNSNNKSSEEYTKLISVLKRWENKGNVRSNTNLNVSNRYFSQISKSLLKRLYEIYEYDFKLFNYAAEPYIQLGKE